MLAGLRRGSPSSLLGTNPPAWEQRGALGTQPPGAEEESKVLGAVLGIGVGWGQQVPITSPSSAGGKGDPGARPPLPAVRSRWMLGNRQTDRQTAPVFSGRPYHFSAWKGATTLFLIMFARKRPPRGNYATPRREGQWRGGGRAGGGLLHVPWPPWAPSPADLPPKPWHNEVGPAGPVRSPPH